MALTRQQIRDALTDDITNRRDGAGSDLREAYVEDSEGIWIVVDGTLDVEALANTVLRLIEKNP